MSGLGWTSGESIPQALLDAKGDLVGASAADTPARLPAGTDGQVLRANSATSTGLEWDTITPGDINAVPTSRTLTAGIALSGGGDLSADRTFDVDLGTTAGTAAEGNDSRITGAQQRSTLTAKGDLYAATAAATTTRLPAGTDGQALRANSATGTGLEWDTLTASDVGAVAVTTAEHIVYGTTTGGAVLNREVSTIASADTVAWRTGQSQLRAATVADGDGNATNDDLTNRLYIAGKLALKQDLATINAKGDLYVGTADNVTTRQPVGTDGQVLRAASAQATGIEYHTLVASDVGAAPTSRAINTTNGLQGGGDLSADRTLSPVYGATANTVAQGNDTRIVNAVQNTRLINTTNGLQGGGALSADLTLQPTYGSTAGTVAQGNDTRIVNAIQQTLFDAKGDLIAASAADTPIRLAVGTDGFVLVANSATASGLEWVAVSALISPSTITRRTTTGDITVANAYLRGVLLNEDTDATIVDIRAGGAGGTLIARVQCTANPSFSAQFDNVLCTSGIHVTFVSGGGTPSVSVIWAAV